MRRWRPCATASARGLRYVFRHRPLEDSVLARRAAELAESAGDDETFWRAHVALMSRSATLTEEDLRVVAEELGLADDEGPRAARSRGGAGR